MNVPCKERFASVQAFVQVPKLLNESWWFMGITIYRKCHWKFCSYHSLWLGSKLLGSYINVRFNNHQV